MFVEPVISIVIPCLNEKKSLRSVLSKAKQFLAKCELSGEIIVVDNGSTDGSDEIAKDEKIKLIYESRIGYGNACRTGLAAARGEYIILIDADETYDFQDAAHLLEKLQNGFDLAIGSRLCGEIRTGAMPWLHRYIGVPFLTKLLNLITCYNLSDAHCGLRLIKRLPLDKLSLNATGMEFASEMLIEASRVGLSITEVPIVYRNRVGKSKLQTIRDGWRHICLILRHCIYLLNRKR